MEPSSARWVSLTPFGPPFGLKFFLPFRQIKVHRTVRSPYNDEGRVQPADQDGAKSQRNSRPIAFTLCTK